MEDLFQVGIITGTHGLKGEVKVFPTTDDKERFLDLDTVLIDTGKELIEKKVQYCKFFKQFVFVKFEGLDDINDVEKYKRCPLKVTRENAVPLEEDEYYVADLLGLTIVDESCQQAGAKVSSTAAGTIALPCHHPPYYPCGFIRVWILFTVTQVYSYIYT